MAKFRKRPVIIEAEQFDELAFWAGIDSDTKFLGLFQVKCEETGEVVNPDRGYLEIPTLEGVMRASMYDWIIKGINGEYYPCKPEIFEKSYEEVLDAK